MPHRRQSAPVVPRRDSSGLRDRHYSTDAASRRRNVIGSPQVGALELTGVSPWRVRRASGLERLDRNPISNRPLRASHAVPDRLHGPVRVASDRGSRVEGSP